MVAPNVNRDPLLAEAQAIYDGRLKSRLEPAETGKFLVVNLDTGEFELDADSLTASRRARARFGSARLIKLRVGHAAAYDIGCAGNSVP